MRSDLSLCLFLSALLDLDISSALSVYTYLYRVDCEYLLVWRSQWIFAYIFAVCMSCHIVVHHLLLHAVHFVCLLQD